MSASAINNGPAALRYNALETRRFGYTAAAEAASRLTIPSLFPPIQDRGVWDKIVTRTPWQNLGARGVNNIASKLLLALLPPNQPFFRFMLQDELNAQLRGDPEMKEQVEIALQDMEKKIMEEIEGNGMRVDVFEMLRHLVTTGNYLLHIPAEGMLRGFDLSNYVAKRNRRGEVLEIVVREGVDEKSAEPRVRAIIVGKFPDREKQTANDREQIFLYTHIIRAGDKVETYQEVLSARVPGSDGVWPLDSVPWLCMRFRKIEGEDYGRGLVEEHIGDLKSLDMLSKAIVQGSAAMAKVLFGVKPGAAVSPRQLSKLDNLGFFGGAEGDVWALQINKGQDFNVAQQTVTSIKEELAYVFMLNSAIQRNGERVTAEEIRFMAGELEDALGGVYSLLSQEFQLPLVKRIVTRMQRRGSLPEIPHAALKPVIVTGLEAIGRGYELTRLQGWGQDVAQLAQLDPSVLQYVDAHHWLVRTAIARGIEIGELVKSTEVVEEERAAAQQQAQQQAMMAATMNAAQSGGEQLGKNLADAAVPQGAPLQIPANMGAMVPGGQQ